MAEALPGPGDKLTEFDYLLLGLSLRADPPTQVVPRNTATGIRIELAFSNLNADAEGLLSLLPSGLEVVAELVGPGIAKARLGELRRAVENRLFRDPQHTVRNRARRRRCQAPPLAQHTQRHVHNGGRKCRRARRQHERIGRKRGTPLAHTQSETQSKSPVF